MWGRNVVPCINPLIEAPYRCVQELCAVPDPHYIDLIVRRTDSIGLEVRKHPVLLPHDWFCCCYNAGEAVFLTTENHTRGCSRDFGSVQANLNMDSGKLQLARINVFKFKLASSLSSSREHHRVCLGSSWWARLANLHRSGSTTLAALGSGNAWVHSRAA